MNFVICILQIEYRINIENNVEERNKFTRRPLPTNGWSVFKVIVEWYFECVDGLIRKGYYSIFPELIKILEVLLNHKEKDKVLHVSKRV